jgi:hypothetical protein
MRAIRREAQVVLRFGFVAGEVLDGTADQPGGGGKSLCHGSVGFVFGVPSRATHSGGL